MLHIVQRLTRVEHGKRRVRDVLALVVVHLDHEHRGLSAALALIRNSGQPVTGAAGTVVVDAAVERDRDRALRGRRRAGRNVAEREDRAAVRHAERIEQLIGQLDLDRRAAVLVERDNVHIHQLVQTVRVLTQLEDLTGKPVIGVVPYGHFDIDDEDSLSERLDTKAAPALVNIAVVKLPRLSNFTDFSALSRVSGVSVAYADKPAQLAGADLIILPGTKSTLADLRWLRESGMEAQILKAHAAGTPVFGICGGYQMMGRTVSDPENTEGGGSLRGIGLLPVETVFRTAKTTVQTHGTVADTAGVLHGLSGLAVEGYEIHMGETVRDADAQPFVTLKHGEHEVPDGCVTENACGTYLHGVFDAPEAAQRLAQALADRKGVTLEGAAEDPAVYRERQYDLLAATVRRSLDMQRIYDIMEGKA